MALAQEDLKQVQELIAAATKPAVEAAAKAQVAAENAHELAVGLQKTLDPAAIQKAAREAAAEAAQEVAQKTVTESLKARDEAAAQSASEAAATGKKKDARAKFIAERAAKVPPAYLAAVPETDDPKVLEEGLAAAVAALKNDAATFGWKLPDLGAAAPAKAEGTQPAAKSAADLAAMSRPEREARLAEVARKTTT